MKHLTITTTNAWSVVALVGSCLTFPSVARAQSTVTSGVPTKRTLSNDVLDTAPRIPRIPQEMIDRKFAEVSSLVSKGRVALKQKRVEEAIDTFNHVLNMDSTTIEAYLGLIDAYAAKSDLASVAQTYRTFLYPAPGKQWTTSRATDPITLMRFALVLNQTGQKDEAMTVYRRALGFLNYTDGKPNGGFSGTGQFPILLEVPLDGSNADNVHTPARFEAAARTAIAMKLWLSYGTDKLNEAEEQLTKAIALQPRFGPAWFYKAIVLQQSSLIGGRSIKKEEITAAFANAEQLVHGSAAKAIVKAQRKQYNY